ncbi:MAG: hypothetical protein CM15mP95_3450 [Alphaproteobacteria bacterium]|nr:MAG: hypothetical protein CM15mP95_3450 [Alphaproteobacteria bacterium]
MLLIGLFLGCIILPAHGLSATPRTVDRARASPVSRRKMLVTASFDYSAVVWKAKGLEEHTTLLGHEAAVNTAEFSPNGKVLATAGDDGVILLWTAAQLGQETPNL